MGVIIHIMFFNSPILGLEVKVSALNRVQNIAAKFANNIDCRVGKLWHSED